MVMKRKLIVHIGMGKTGSSSIQKTLRLENDKLHSNGVKYLGLMLEQARHDNSFFWQRASGWVGFIQQGAEKANQQMSSALVELDDLLPKHIHTLVWSNESFFEGFDYVKDAISSVKEIYDIEIVGYIRRPDAWITSAYLQWGIKHKSYSGPIKPFRAWVVNRHYHVSPLIDQWRLIDQRSKFFNFDAIEDIAYHFVEAMLSPLLGKIKISRENETPSPVAMAMFAYYNSSSKDEVLPSELEPLLRISGVLSKSQPIRAYNNLLPYEQDVKKYLEDNREQVEKVNKIFEAQGEPVFDISVPKIKDYSTNQHEINRALLQMIKCLSTEVDALKKEIENKGASDD